MIRALAIAATLAGCYRPTPPTGAPCDDLTPCPTGQACVTCRGSLEIDEPIVTDDAPTRIPAARSSTSVRAT